MIYRCHRGEVDPKKPCGYWIAYEPEVLPFLLGNFLDAVREEIERQTCHVVNPAKVSTEVERLERELERLDRRLDVARQRYLEASKGVAKGVLASLERMEVQRQQLVDKIAAQQPRQVSPLLEWWQAYRAEFFEQGAVKLPDGMQRISQGADGQLRVGSTFGVLVDEPLDEYSRQNAPALLEKGDSVLVQMRLPASVLREKLKKIGTKVSIWWKPKAKGRGWDIDKMRAVANVNGNCVYEYTSSAAS